MKMVTGLWIAIFVLIPFHLSAQNYPFLKSVGINITISHDESKSLFLYSYRMESSPINTGSIQKLEIDISRRDGSMALDTTGLRFDSQFESNNFHERFPQLSNKIVPVGIPVLPGKEWVGMLTNRYTVSISADSAFVGPGKSLTPIVITSKGLPSIRTCIIAPNFQDDLLFPSIEDTSANAMTTVQMDSVRNAVNYHGWTIGPTAPPMNFDPSVWVDTLLSYTHQSVDLGWLGKSSDDDCDNDEHPQDGIEKNIERRLTMAQRDLQHGDSVKARRDLQMLVNKVDRIWKRGQIEGKRHEHDRGDWWQHRKDWVIMTSEAYALLKYNTEYLIDRLPERERRGGKEKMK